MRVFLQEGPVKALALEAPLTEPSLRNPLGLPPSEKNLAGTKAGKIPTTQPARFHKLPAWLRQIST